MKYVVITPVRNEAAHIVHTLNSMAYQSVKPTRWVIVDDGSSDATPDIVDHFRTQYSWMQLIGRSDRGFRQRGAGVVEAFYVGYDALHDVAFDVIAKLDGDVCFNFDYFERLLQILSDDARLGITGGAVYEPDGEQWKLASFRDHVRGPTKVYRRTCFEAIGGIVRSLGWDGLDEWQARVFGWRVQTAMEVPLLHYRPTGGATGSLKTRVELGYGAHSIGYHPLFMLARSIRHLAKPPYVVGSCAMMGAYLWASLTRRTRAANREVIRYVRRTQLSQLAGLLFGKSVHQR
ncbi:MAG: glycosyltransferase family 2 protein [Acidobacteriota bacterium]